MDPACSDLDEATQCVKELHAPLYLHELVKRVFVVAMDGGEKEAERASQLVAHLHKQGVLRYGMC